MNLLYRISEAEARKFGFVSSFAVNSYLRTNTTELSFLNLFSSQQLYVEIQFMKLVKALFAWWMCVQKVVGTLEVLSSQKKLITNNNGEITKKYYEDSGVPRD